MMMKVLHPAVVLTILIIAFAQSAIIAYEGDSMWSYSRADSNVIRYLNGYAAEDGDASVTPFSWMPTYNLGTVHKILGYSALLSGLTAIGSGIAMKRGGEDNANSRAKSIHGVSAACAGIFTITAFSSGVLSYASQLDFGNGMTTYTNHALLGTLASVGFIAA
ncbi:MAG TPA: hypothetical protein PKK43_15100, partial [Spirochaetota bacterium]|nr:hypothetical protein [Spirochaetota bacterium]